MLLKRLKYCNGDCLEFAAGNPTFNGSVLVEGSEQIVGRVVAVQKGEP